MKYDSICPGKIWLDTEGKPIQAHGFSVFYKDGLYYWYGENKEKTRAGGKIWHWGVRCYTSEDLYNWEDKGLIIPPEPEDFHSPLHPNRCMDRPHIIYCENTGKYVAWLKIMGEGNEQCMCVMQADQFEGPYEYVEKFYRPLQMSTGDFDIYKDDSTGKAYLIFDRPHFEIIVAELDGSYCRATGKYSVHCQTDGTACAGREAPVHFVRDEKHYLLTSGTSWYYPNPSRIDTFTDIHGEYEDIGNPCRGEDDFISFGGQFTDVLKVPGKDLYIACADRWITDLDLCRQRAKSMEAYAKIAPKEKPDLEPKVSFELPKEEQVYEADTFQSTYVWLPIKWENDCPVILWRDEWKLDEFE